MDTNEPLWLLGFFTGRLHAVTNPDDCLVFKGILLAWSVCGAPVVVETQGAPGPFCPTCVNRVGVTVTWTASGAALAAGLPDPLGWPD
jgi:hypothetical protein